MSVSFITNDMNELNQVDDIDDIDFGVDIQEQAINQEQANEQIELKEGEFFNPFFVGITGGNLTQLNWGDIHRNYNSVVILTISNNNDLKQNNTLSYLFNRIIKQDNLLDVNGITYFRTGLNILKNRDEYFKANIVSKSNLNELFPNGVFNESEIVIGIFEMTEDNTRTYCNMYQSHDELDQVEQKLDMFNYYIGDKINTRFIKHDNIFSELKDSDYWKNNSNLDINITTSFVDREFNNQRSNTNTFTVITDRNQHLKETNIPPTGEQKVKVIKQGAKDYPVGVEQNDKDVLPENKVKKLRENFVDPSTMIRTTKDGKKRNFYPSHLDNKYTNEHIYNIFNNIKDEKMKYMFVNNMLSSKEYCHLIANNKQLLEGLNPLFQKYQHVFKYTFGYAWLTFYLEECLARTRAHKKSRFVYDIDTANKLPVFPFALNDLKQNPYMTVLIDDSELVKDNVYGLTYKENYDGYGVCDLETFKKRFNMFTSEDPLCDPLKGIDWTKFAVSGSSVTACLQKRSQLLDEMVKMNNNDETQGFVKFVRKYYGESDIDLMSNENNFIDFLNSVHTVYDLLKTNLNASESERKYTVVKSFAISITQHFFTDYLDDFNKTFNSKITEQEFENMTDSIIFKVYLYNKYIETKIIITQKLISEKKVNIDNKFIAEYLVPNNYESMNIYKVDADNYENYGLQDTEVLYYRNHLLKDEQNAYSEKDNKMVIKFSENLRFQLYCKKTKIEMFRIKEKEFFSAVARFHFPCVRSYYQGDNVYILPSCISAMMTGLNIEYKYFAGIRNPNEIINKYLFRGFGVLLNKFELNLWLEYNKTSDNTQYKFKFVDKLVGPKYISNEIFDLNLTNQNNVLYDSDKLKEYYSQKQSGCVDCTKMTTITKNGNINKFQHSYVELCYDEMN
jgi:hypothetical protein